ncbi:hypothetical protein ACVWW3_006390 [Bradyrhizobium sp. LM2.9]
MIAEEDEAEDRRLDRLGLQVGRRHHEGPVIHRQQHQAGRHDLAERAEQQPRPEHGRRHAEMIAGRDQHHGEKQQREREAEQEADIGRAPGPQRLRQRPLHRIARDLSRARQ